MTIHIFALKGDLNGENRSGAFLFCGVFNHLTKEEKDMTGYYCTFLFRVHVFVFM